MYVPNGALSSEEWDQLRKILVKVEWIEPEKMEPPQPYSPTRREYVVIKVLQSIMNSRTFNIHCERESTMKMAIEYADDVIKLLDKDK